MLVDKKIDKPAMTSSPSNPSNANPADTKKASQADSISNPPLEVPTTRILLKGDIVWVDLGTHNEGSKIIDKERPCLILRDNCDGVHAVVIQNNTGNRYSDTVILAAITHTETDFPFHVPLNKIKGRDLKIDRKGSIKLDQIFTVDKSNVKNHAGCLTKEDLKLVDAALIKSLGITK